MHKRIRFGWIIFGLMGIFFFTPTPFGHAEADRSQTLNIYPIGKVVKEEGRTFIVLDEKYAPGLLGLERFSFVTVLYWFDRNDTPKKRATLQVHPRGNPKNPLRGVFATHSPVRPNLIGVSRCRIISVKDNVVEVEDIDAFHGSPVIDLKNG
ncbi:MAG: SAM-dependent methyltransferase [Thermodesulfobacteriota bacterium]